MERLTLKKDGTMEKRNRPVSGSPLGCLSLLVDLEQGFTLASFFSMLQRYNVFLELSELLEPLAAMARDAGRNYPKDPGLDRLVFFKTIAMKGFPGDPALEIYNSLKGVKGSQILGLKFFQMESLLEHELCLGDLKHIIFGDTQDMFTYATNYSLYELIEGVAWEMSFNFNPLQCSLRG